MIDLARVNVGNTIKGIFYQSINGRKVPQRFNGTVVCVEKEAIVVQCDDENLSRRIPVDSDVYIYWLE